MSGETIGSYPLAMQVGCSQHSEEEQWDKGSNPIGQHCGALAKEQSVGDITLENSEDQHRYRHNQYQKVVNQGKEATISLLPLFLAGPAQAI